MKIPISPLLLFLVSCQGIGNRIKDRVEFKVAEAKQQMNDEIEKTRNNFTSIYHTHFKDDKDSLHKQQLLELYNIIDNTGSYLDSLKMEMDKMDMSDVNNSFKVKQAFLYKNAGDSILNKLKRSISTAMTLAKTKEQKDSIEAVNLNLLNEPDVYKWKEQYFGLNNSFGASMIIYGFQTDLYRIGTLAMQPD